MCRLYVKICKDFFDLRDDITNQDDPFIFTDGENIIRKLKDSHTRFLKCSNSDNPIAQKISSIKKYCKSLGELRKEEKDFIYKYLETKT